MKYNYISSLEKQFKYYKHLGEKSFHQLSDEQLFIGINSESNSIAIIVNHLWGNMLSRFTDFLTTDGEKEWRERDLEFKNVITTREDMMKKWEEGWAITFQALSDIKEVELTDLIYIRNIGHTIIEAMNRQLAHYAYHIGQIVFQAKAIKGSEWTSLSIPKNKSEEYNAMKFAKEKHRGHYTDEYLNNEKG